MDEARLALNFLRYSFEQTKDTKEEIFNAVVTMDNANDAYCLTSLKQKKITDFAKNDVNKSEK